MKKKSHNSHKHHATLQAKWPVLNLLFFLPPFPPLMLCYASFLTNLIHLSKKASSISNLHLKPQFSFHILVDTQDLIREALVRCTQYMKNLRDYPCEKKSHISKNINKIPHGCLIIHMYKHNSIKNISLVAKSVYPKILGGIKCFLYCYFSSFNPLLVKKLRTKFLQSLSLTWPKLCMSKKKILWKERDFRTQDDANVILLKILTYSIASASFQNFYQYSLKYFCKMILFSSSYSVPRPVPNPGSPRLGHLGQK